MHLPLPLNAVPTAQIAIPLPDLTRSGPLSDADLSAEPIAITIPEDFEAALASLGVPDLTTVPTAPEEQPPIPEVEPNADADVEADAETRIEAALDLPDQDSETPIPFRKEAAIPVANEEREKLPSEFRNRLSQPEKPDMPVLQHPEPQRPRQPEKPEIATQRISAKPATSILSSPDPRPAATFAPVAEVVIAPVAKAAKPDMPDRPMVQETPPASKSAFLAPAVAAAPKPLQKAEKTLPVPFMVSSAPSAEAPDQPAPLPAKALVRQTPAPAVLPVKPAPVPPAKVPVAHAARPTVPMPGVAANPSPANITPAVPHQPRPAMAVEALRQVVLPVPTQQPAEVQALPQKAASLKQSALPAQSDVQPSAPTPVREPAPANIPEPARLARPEQPAPHRPAAPLPHLPHVPAAKPQPQRSARALERTVEMPAPAQVETRAALPFPQKPLAPPVEPLTERQHFIENPGARNFAPQETPKPPAATPAQMPPQQMPTAALSFTPATTPEADGPVSATQSDQHFMRLDPVQSTAPAAPAVSRADLPAPALRQILDVTQQMPAKPVEISLSPEELGRVRLSVSTADTAVQLIVLAERPETLDLMRRHIALLGQQFQAMGFQDVSFSFSAWAGAQDRKAGSEVPQPHQEDPVEEAPQNTATTKATGTGLDLRL